MKQCSKCKEWKELSEFNKNRSNIDGFAYYCRSCTKEENKQWCLNNPDKEKEIKKRWRLNNPDKEKERKKQYRLNNPDKEKERSKQYRLNNPDKEKERHKQYRLNNPDKVIISGIKINLKRSYNISDAPADLIECKLLIIKTKKLCKTSSN